MRRVPCAPKKLSALGSPVPLANPGLMPTKADREAQRENVSRAVQALGRSGWQVEGQVVITRNAAKSVARVALWLQVEHVVLAAPQGRVRRFVQG